MKRRLLSLIAISLAVQTSQAQPATRIEYARDIRPILSNYCFACHGVDVSSRKGKLRLDVREEALKKAIVPGKPGDSELVRRVHATDPSEMMPPAKHLKRPSETEKKLLRTWIEQGAEYQPHWAFVAPRRPALPAVRDGKRVRNEIDRFILARLEAQGLTLSAEADRATLVRRASLDLTGLPPTPGEVDAALGDASESWFENVLDRLLASPHYGERMAMPWLDLARYADTNGYNNDEERTMWAWREWVIDAFNDNMPFDRFLTEQLAGDLLPNATPEQKVASGFNRNHVLTTEGGIIPEEYRVEYVADRVHTTATVFLGLSLSCARCHDHKYDPFSQVDYYRFFGFFNNQPDAVFSYSDRSGAAPPHIKVPTRRQKAVLDDLLTQESSLERRIADRMHAREELFRTWQGDVTSGRLAAIAEAVRSTSVFRMGTKNYEQRLRRYFFERVEPETAKLHASLADLRQQRKAIESTVPLTMVMQEMSPPRTTHLLKRGQYDQPGDRVEADVPASLPVMPSGAPHNRLGLARWMTDPANPLTARVAVNRWWEMLFGAGIVETAEDFGLQGSWPSHPELLDWLAVELIENRGASSAERVAKDGSSNASRSTLHAPRSTAEASWNVKAMLKRIMTSATYRQESTLTPVMKERDPKNRLLGRYPRLRLPAETVRDNALAVSGLLSRDIGGPSVKPYQPAGLWQDVSVERRAVYTPSKGHDLYRRSLYTYWKRTCPPPSLMSFDAPDRETCLVRRARTNTPLQALVLLNDPTYLEAARKLAERAMSEATTEDQRLTQAFRLAVSRPSRPSESQVLLALHSKALQRFRAEPQAAAKLLSIGESPRDPRHDPAELAAWTTIASMVLNLDEAITKE